MENYQSNRKVIDMYIYIYIYLNLSDNKEQNIVGIAVNLMMIYCCDLFLLVFLVPSCFEFATGMSERARNKCMTPM